MISAFLLFCVLWIFDRRYRGSPCLNSLPDNFHLVHKKVTKIHIRKFLMRFCKVFLSLSPVRPKKYIPDFILFALLVYMRFFFSLINFLCVLKFLPQILALFQLEVFSLFNIDSKKYIYLRNN